MLHGNAESGLAWWRWVPKVARHYRVVRPDMRGFGQSSSMPHDFPWTLDRLIEDFCLLMDHLGIDRFHLLGAKIGGTIARAFAARRPERVKTLTVVGTPPPFREDAAKNVASVIKMLEDHGVEYWARQNMGNRLGRYFPPEGFEFWVKYMGRTALSTQLGFMPTIAIADIRPDIAKIKCPTLVVTTEESGLGSVNAMRAWQEQIAGSELVVFAGNSYHVAATHADQAADAMLDFLKRKG
jgi:pimeloyl-ACP methyl ester carboxylesterase